MIDGSHEQVLTGGGDTLLHYHLADRATNAGLQSDQRISTVTTNRNVLDNEDILLVDTSGGAVSLTLPPSRNGREHEFVLTDATNQLTLYPATGDTIMGETDAILTIEGTALRLKATVMNWIAI